ncbi:hypothetical protein KSP39_PZI015827 [Platanthera zijinensis]|uniref:Myb/SANT-like domain-containing protein n=1 Tax=Platanthera zijinensis TaxID=2320716 RepID=A0AAP0B988_9ASPA
MGKPKEGGIQASWESGEVMLFCDLCIKEIGLGNRPTTHFSKEGWTNLIAGFKERTGKSYDQLQMKNKWDHLKKDWKLWKELKHGETGLGWDPEKRTIAASEEWWADKIKVVPAAKKFRSGGISPELEEKLDSMFSQVVATGEASWAPSIGSLPPDVVTVKEVVELLSSYSELMDNLELYYFALEHIRDKTTREIFMSIPEHMRVWWIMKAYEKRDQ